MTEDKKIAISKVVSYYNYDRLNRDVYNGVKVLIRQKDDVLVEKTFRFDNYFYASQNDSLTVQQLLQSEYDYAIRDISEYEADNGNFIKIILSNNYMQRKVTKYLKDNGIKLYESDIDAGTRWMIRNYDRIKKHIYQTKLRHCFYDLETRDDGDFLFQKVGDYEKVVTNSSILSCSIHDDKGKVIKFFKNHNENEPSKGERQLLIDIFKCIKPYDIVSAFNGNMFDDVYIRDKLKYHNLQYEFNIWERNFVDYKVLCEKNIYGELDSKSLESFSTYFLGEDMKKIKMPDGDSVAGNGNIYRTWLSSFKGSKLLEEYNNLDVKLMYEIENARNILEICKIESSILGCNISSTMYNSHMGDFAFLHELNNSRFVCDDKPNQHEKKIRKEKYGCGGAYTGMKKHGVYPIQVKKDQEEKIKNVGNFIISLDFKSFYPCMVRTYNISFDTIVFESPMEESKRWTLQQAIDYAKKYNFCFTPADYESNTKKKNVYHPFRFYRRDKLGVAPKLAEQFITERDKYKYRVKEAYDNGNKDEGFRLKLIEMAFKYLANSVIYGFVTTVISRFMFPSRWNENSEFIPVGDSITSVCRDIIKAIEKHLQSLGLITCFNDTDSLNVTRVDDEGNVTCTLTIEEIESEIQKFFDDYMKKFNLPDFNSFNHTDALTKNIIKKNHWVVFEHEKDITKALLVMPKNYAYKEWNKKKNCFEYTIKGLEMKKTSTSSLGKYIQKMVVMDALNDCLDYDKYLKELRKIHKKMFNYELDIKDLAFNRPVKKRIEDYGLPVIRQSGKDKGKVWIKKDGSTRYSSIPPHIKIATKMRENGEFIPIGYKIKYIVNGHDPIVPITIEEYERDKQYDCEYYWYSMMKPFIKVIRVLNPKFLTIHEDLFGNNKMLKSVISEIEKEVEESENSVEKIMRE